jgi:hypothetical protein
MPKAKCNTNAILFYLENLISNILCGNVVTVDPLKLRSSNCTCVYFVPKFEAKDNYMSLFMVSTVMVSKACINKTGPQSLNLNLKFCIALQVYINQPTSESASHQTLLQFHVIYEREHKHEEQ